MRLHLFACAIALAGAGCADQNEPPPQPFDSARYAGRLRAAMVLRAEQCSPNEAELLKEVTASGVPPANYTAANANSFHAGFAEYFSPANRPEPSPQACQSLRANRDYAALFKVNPATSARRTVRRTNDRPKPNQPAYCPTGYVKAKVDEDWTTARDAIKQDCRSGDSLILPAYASGLIASVCDTGKPISKISEDVVCTLGTIRSTRGTN